MDDIMPVLTEDGRDPRVNAFVGEPSHALAGSAKNDFFVSQIIGGKRLRGTDIFESKMGISGKELTCLHSRPEFAEHELYRHTRALDHGLCRP
jgi:hypothetical protein